ncbi:MULTISPECIES: CsgG/HfaB family protein [unclassified Colwellia]|uniref:CsgG/HfaB family protein n=1 Tax=unclassified Colwellia TaxID=196834 RepID=UPI0015F5184C|nr:MULTISPECIES: CsgG/HfaB family protein [unclassified Colwellia]MBA6232476.1 curli production assembly protein CsgG [Colwellia sp. MB02u-7]MBA6237687.1 curli production assembly protein CsgG [Colwellia sp. MB02u-11]MBA6255370.1 curli production assembly protein CsgG [Colwellia sp. MB3u-28]MBA6261510.1 curli production assembly protein CsgG [Colwellia sp. MB3u-41]MBA6299544.1 curli production assembly protein CsgG [Colwellia sp. MB3u-22]
MNYRNIILAFSCVAISACTSSTRSTINKPLNPPSQISKVIAQAPEKSLKRVVAISRFSDETKRGNSFFVDKNNNRIGKQASDILSARLTESGKFLMLERSDLAALDNENNLNGDESNTVAADYMIIGSVSEYGRSTTSEVGVFSRNKIQKANVTVNIRLVNTKTSQVLYSEEATGEALSEANHVLGVGERAGYNTSLDDKALSAAISKLVSNVMENLLDSPWQAYFLSNVDNQLFMSGGEEQGIKLSDMFQVLQKGKKVKNPQTGHFIELPGKKVAKIKVLNFIGKGLNSLSITEIVSGSIDESKLTDYVIREL